MSRAPGIEELSINWRVLQQPSQGLGRRWGEVREFTSRTRGGSRPAPEDLSRRVHLWTRLEPFAPAPGTALRSGMEALPSRGKQSQGAKMLKLSISLSCLCLFAACSNGTSAAKVSPDGSPSPDVVSPKGSGGAVGMGGAGATGGASGTGGVISTGGSTTASGSGSVAGTGGATGRGGTVGSDAAAGGSGGGTVGTGGASGSG